MSYYTDNPVLDAYRYDADQEAMLEKLPKCSYCDKPIQEDYCYEINDELVCRECLDEHFRKWVEDYAE